MDPANKGVPDSQHLKSREFTYTPESGDPYLKFDTNQMIQDIQNSQANIDKANLEAAVRNYSKNYKWKADLSENPKSSGSSHYQTILAAQEVNSMIVKEPGTYCSLAGPSGSKRQVLFGSP